MWKIVTSVCVKAVNHRAISEQEIDGLREKSGKTYQTVAKK